MATLPAGFRAHHQGWYYADDGTGPYMIDAAGKASQGMPDKMFTDHNGVSARLRVDQGSTDFFAGHAFRSFLEFSIGAGATQVIRVTAVADFILSSQNLSVEDGTLRFAVAAGTGVPGGVFGTPLPVIGRNRLAGRPAPFYVPTLTLDTGGTHTGGTEVEVIRLKTASATAQQSTVNAGIGTERGLPAGVYYLRLQNLGAGTCTGVYTLEWEERT